MSDAAAAVGGGDTSGGSAASSGGTSSGGVAPDTGGGSGGAGYDPSAPRQVLPRNGNFGDGNVDDAADDGNADPAKPKAEKPPAPKYKRKWQGKEVESEGAELARMLSDDYEHEFRGVDGKPVKQRWTDIQRAVQKESGALAAIQAANEQRRQLSEEREWGKKNVHEYMESRLGVPDYREWVRNEAQRLYQEDQRMVELQKSNPFEAQRLMRQQAEQAFTRKQKIDQARAESETQSRQQQESDQRYQSAVLGTLQAAKLPANAMMFQIADQIIQQHGQAGIKLSQQDVADLTRKAYHELIHSYFDGMDDDSKLSFLGDERRTKLRELEVTAARGRKREERQQQAPAQQQQQPAKPRRIW